MQIEWRDGFGSWTAVPEAESADGTDVTFADEGTVIGPSGHICAPAEWRDGFGDWAS